MDIFDLIGPIMVGPSSSHTAGAVRIGYVARKIFREEPVSAEIILHGSFAATGLGHGTDRALVAGLLGMHPDDSRIPNSFEIAQERGLDFRFESRELRNAHPNTAKIKLRAADGRELEISAASVGGGRIEVRELAGMPMRFTADKPTLIISNNDKPGSIAKVSEVLSREKINIATFNVNRSSRGGRAIMGSECDSIVSPEALQHIADSPEILSVAFVDPD